MMVPADEMRRSQFLGNCPEEPRVGRGTSDVHRFRREVMHEDSLFDEEKAEYVSLRMQGLTQEQAVVSLCDGDIRE